METLTKERKTIEVKRGVKSENLSKVVIAGKPKENPFVTIANDVKVSSELEKKKAMLKKAELDNLCTRILLLRKVFLVCNSKFL